MPSSVWDVQLSETERVARWRYARLSDLGYDDADVVLLLAAGADWHALQVLLDQGCTLPLALAILT